MVANPARTQLKRENNVFRVPVRASLLISILSLNLVLTHGINIILRIHLLSGTGSIHIYIYTCIYNVNRHRVGPEIVYRVTQLRTDGVRCQESAGTGPVVLKVQQFE